MAGPRTGSEPGLRGGDPALTIMTQEAVAVINLGIDPDKFRGWPRWRRKLVLLGLAQRARRQEEPAGSWPG